MNVLLDDFVDGILHKVHDSLIPTVDGFTQKATNELKNRLQTPPSSVDLLYITDRLIVSSKPAVSSNPSYNDNGRDDIPTNAQNSTQTPIADQKNGNSEKSNDKDSFKEETILQNNSTEATSDEKCGSLNEIREALASISQPGVTLAEEKPPAPISCLDTSDTLVSKEDIGMAKSDDAENIYRTANEGKLSVSTQTNEKAIFDFIDEQSFPVPAKNSPGIMASFLDRRHGSEHYLAFSLMDEPPDDRTLLLFRRQIVQIGWWSPCCERSETPSVSDLLKTCYAIHAYLQLDTKHVALIYCSNGKTRTAIAVACYLKFVGIVKHCREGFFRFLTMRGIENPEATWRQLPPSLRLFFEQFDSALSIGGYLNRKPLRLRAIALQGVPVEDKPCLDIWDSSQRHVYSSHPEMWGRNKMLHKSATASSQWIDEEGLYEVNVCLDGDFLMLCRFGGEFANDAAMHDPSKVLFRYTNNTGFLAGGCPYELQSTKVDLTRRYALHLDHDDFLMTLMFQSDWEEIEGSEQEESYSFPGLFHERKKSEKASSSEPSNGADLSHSTSYPVWRSHDRKAYEEGLRIIFQHHCARPDATDIKKFRSLRGERLFDRCAGHLICLALQLTNFNHSRTNDLLLTCQSFAWWRLHSPGNTSLGETAKSSSLETNKGKGPNSFEKNFDKDEKKLQNMLGMLNGIDIYKNLDLKDIADFKELDASQKLHLTHLDMQSTPERRNSSFLCVKHSVLEECSDDAGWLVPGISFPRAGDVIRSFGANSLGVDNRFHPPTLESSSFPRFPHHRDLKSNLGVESASAVVKPYDRQRDISTQVLLQTEHTGLTLPGLFELLRESEQWDGVSSRVRSIGKEVLDVVISSATDSKESSMNRKSKEQKEKEWEEACSAEERDKSSRKKSVGDQASPDPGEQQPLQQTGGGADSWVPLKDDPEYAKYFKMLKMGMPLAQVEHAMKRDDKDPKVLKLDPEKSLDEQIPEQPENEFGDLALKEDPEYEKYFRMLKMGLPKDAVKNALVRDGKDPSVIDLDPLKSLSSQLSKCSSCNDPPLQDDPDYQKYFKMLKMGMPRGAVKNALLRDGKDPSILDLDPGKSLKSQTLLKEDTGIALKDDPEYRKYFKMIAMGLPADAVKNALMRDGKDPSVLDLDPSKSVRFQLGKNGNKDTGIPLRDDPEYAKYFKMLGMGLPLGAVKNALERDGKDPHILDLDPDKSIAYQLKESSASKKSPAKKKKVRRKKIYWNPIDPGKLKKDSMWHIVRDAVNMNNLNYDQKEFEELFTESADPKDAKRKKPEKKAKKLVQVIDPKRSMNGGIILARLKIDYSKIADIVNKMERSKFEWHELRNLRELLPDADERRGLIGYMNSKAPKEELYAELSETEKYMYTMIDVAAAAEKIDAMLLRCVFKNRFDDVNAGIKTLSQACDQLRSSEKLRKLFAIILMCGNEINGDANLAIGFTLDALLKLNEAKAFDKKTSVLHYVVKLVKKNDPGLLTFSNDISSVIPAESVLLDSLANEVKALGQELAGVHKTVQAEAERLEEAGELRPMTLEDLKEQRTTVRQVGNVSQFNKIDHHTGRTPMERFMFGAKCSCDEASQAIEDVRKKYLALLEYFGEDENMQTGDFFGILRRFMREFQKAVDQVEAIEKKEAKERKRAAARAAKSEANNPGKQTGKTKSSRRGGKSVLQTVPRGELANTRSHTGVGDDAATGKRRIISESIRGDKQQTRSDLLSAMAAAAASRKGRLGKGPSKVTKIDSTVTEKMGEKASRVETGDRGDFLAGTQDTTPATLKPENNSESPIDSYTLPAQSQRNKGRENNTSTAPEKFLGSEAAPQIAGDENGSSTTGDSRRKGKTKLQEDGVEVEDLSIPLTNADPVAQTSSVADAISTQPNRTSDSTKILINDGFVESIYSQDIMEAGESRPIAREQSSQVKHQSDESGHGGPSSVSMEALQDNRNSAFNQGRQETSGSATKTADYEPKESILNVIAIDGKGKITADSQSTFQDEEVGQTEIAVSDVGDSRAKATAQVATLENLNIETVDHMSILGTTLNQCLPTRESGGETSEPMVERPRSPSNLIPKDEAGTEGHVTEKSQDKFEAYRFNHAVLPEVTLNSPEEIEIDEAEEVPTKSFDDFSLTESIPKQTMEVRMSKTWTDGEDITNWMPWADEVIKGCDSDSVVGFEVPRDLNDGFEFDDDSTVASTTSFASNYDDLSVASGFSTPGKMGPLQYTTTPPFDPYFEEEQSPNHFFGIGGRLEAGSPLDDSQSPVVSLSRPPFQLFDPATLSGAASTPRHDVGLDSGLSFGAHVGFDGGLGGFGAISNIDKNGDTETQSSKNGAESRRKGGWFPWGGGGGGN